MNTSAISITLVAALAAAAVPATAQEDWSRVRRLEPGSEITVTIGSSQPVERLFVSADDSVLTVLNLTDPTSPATKLRRASVAEITTRRKGRGIWGHLGPLGGWFAGAIAGGYGAGLACQAAAGRDRCDTGAFMTGMLVGGITAGTYGFHAARRETEYVIYRTP
jgi:hypothetical protein